MSAERPRLKLSVSPAAERHLRAGHPWVYESSVRGQNRDGDAGELAVVYDKRNRFLAVGLYDPHSPLRLRALHAGSPATIDLGWWQARFQTALDRRAALFGADTDGYRVLNGESDGFPALVVDCYADTLVLKVYSAAWFPHLPLILDLLAGAFPSFRAVLRLSRNIQALAAAVGLSDGQTLVGEPPAGAVIFRESGLAFEADVVQGQKTGFFLDQRENRRRVRDLARGRRVLNAFSFSGGFSLYAAQGGASEVVSLDISRHALQSSERNWALNPQLTAPHRTVQADVFEWLGGPGETFDLVILDPPSLARREAEREGAIRAYHKLARDGIARLERGGLLLSASCSAHVSAEEFWDTVRQAAERSGRNWREVAKTQHAPDHHASFEEAQYLKAIYLQFEE
ncbi:23S rRNA (cytosine(2499)-C(5))-methyltransferase [Deinococcus radiophilus]|uniref:23S rRNA (Cytosine(2499)-C(5))-methyltransferase n=1 Tax=Deinococcus radiophilus TaxID=32062 RepID=A0A431VQ92_9DEIO|nr:23S rRNA (cytosine(2499)-C(5))-methyltransferase [Deinococcus radiophilus]RTR25344.1 23S rRNA (cytosine(2499)-C(5))-methyltransferase [Deinococcus radiophilus]UFA50490.1 23S rRNA (cytosine(2499)-C(5))-methyltransferase [Deinococcus radiophilus]